MQKKHIMMMLAAGCALGMLTGCGVPKEEHLAALQAKDDAFKEMQDSLNQKIADQENVIKSEKAKVRTSRIELDDASGRIKKLQQEKTDGAQALAAEKTKVADLTTQLRSQKSATAAAQDRAEEAEGKYNTQVVEFEALKRRFEMYQKNMAALNNPASVAPAAAPASDTAELEALGGTEPQPVPDTNKGKVNSLLDQMGNM